MTSHADSHDLDKLKRWNDGLASEKPDEFPVHALFLVSDESKAELRSIQDQIGPLRREASQ